MGDEQQKESLAPYIKWGWPILIDLYPSTLYVMVIATHVLNSIGIFYALCMMIGAIQIQRSIGDYLNMVTDGDGTVVPSLLVIVALISLPLNITSIVLISRLTANDAKHQNRRRSRWVSSSFVNFALFLCAVIGAVVALVQLSVALSAVCHAYMMHHRLHDGIQDAIRRYRNETAIKMRVDILQITFHCCGSRKYTEWFDVDWYQDTTTPASAVREQHDDVPFSCCTMASLYPCIHHDLLAIGNTYAYAPETNLSVAEHGCHPVLLRHARSVAWRTALALSALSLGHGVLCVLTRLIQTAYYHRRYHRTYVAWLVGCYRGAKGNRRNEPPEPPASPPQSLSP